MKYQGLILLTTVLLAGCAKPPAARLVSRLRATATPAKN